MTIRRLCLLLAAALIVLGLVAPVSGASPVPDQKEPRTGFEESGGAEWTTHEQELDFLAEVDELSRRVTVKVIGKTKEKRPLHLVQLGDPAPHSRKKSLKQPTVLFVCTQHGNEPAGREACLKLLRDLAFTDDPTLVEQLREMTILFIPTANPDGRAANTRGNSDDVDINRDHLNLETAEAQTIARMVRDWRPDVVLDLHEYGPSIPALYDDEVLYLWPRNMNVDDQVHDLAKHLGDDYIKKEAEEHGYTADQYGMYAVADQDIHQSAGDGDEGIMRNTMGLRHSLGVLVETAVTEDPRNGPQEVTSEAAVNLRRVDAHMVTSMATLHFLQKEGNKAASTSAGAARRKTAEGRKRSEPVYFDGADNEEPTTVQDPPPCGYFLTQEQLRSVGNTLALLDIAALLSGKKVYVPMGQPGEPLIPLLLDERGARHGVAGKPDSSC